MKRSMKRSSLYFFLFNLVFLLWQVSYIALQGKNFLTAIPLPLQTYLELITTGFIQLCLYLLLTLIQSVLFWGVAKAARDEILDQWQVFIFALTIIALLTANCYFFPLSVFSRLFIPILSPNIIFWTLISSLFLLGLLTLNAIWQLVFIERRALWPDTPIFRYLPKFFDKIVLCILAGLVVFQVANNKFITNNKLLTKPISPNIIIIGVDSLSPERITTATTPHLQQWMQQSVYFKETISPLARTYAAWASILTGLEPLHHQARYNLMPSKHVKSQNSLAWALQKKGYQTVFATDDRRFNSISNDFGFEEILGPKLGVNDFLLGTFNDFPLSNLLINSAAGRWLFPYNYANRASFFSYYPRTFDKLLQTFITTRAPQRPLFLAVHFALPHWPYAFAQSAPAQVKNEYSVTEREQLYFESLQQVDKQIGHLLRVVQETKLLENSLLIVLSDHGEVLYETGSRPLKLANYQGGQQNLLSDYFRRKTATPLEVSTGHGSDLLSPSQFFCLLGIKIYQQGKLLTKPKTIKNRVSLIDVAPTVAAFLNLSLKQSFDGISLLDSLIKPTLPLPNRIFTLESGELPNQIISRNKARLLGKWLYRVNPENNQLELRADQLHKLDAIKLYAILQDDWLLALYPDDYQYLPVILHLSDKKWTDQWHSAFAQSSPAPNMLNQLLQFYRQELASYPQSKLSPQFTLKPL